MQELAWITRIVFFWADRQPEACSLAGSTSSPTLALHSEASRVRFPQCPPDGLLRPPELANFLELLPRQFSRHIAARHLRCLHLRAYRLHDLRICEGGDIAGAHEVGYAGDDPAHDLSGAGLGHVRNDPHILRARALPT